MRHLTHKLITVEVWNQIKSIVKSPKQRKMEEEFRRALRQRELMRARDHKNDPARVITFKGVNQ